MGVTRRALLWLGERQNAQRVISRAPLTRRVARRFVAGERTEDAVEAIGRLNARGLGGILNLLGEGVTDAAGIDTAVAGYAEAIAAAAEAQLNTSLTVKPSQLGVSIDATRVRGHLREIDQLARDSGVGLEVDMEHADLVEATLDAYLGAGLNPLPRLALQACLHRSPDDLRSLMHAGARIRLVKGAYLEPSRVAIQDADAVSASYREMTSQLLQNGDDPAFATHDSSLIRHAIREARRLGRSRQSYEFQMLYGIRRDLQSQLAQAGFRVSVYVPFGSSWYPYLVRRLAERPANLRFFARALIGG